MSKTQELSDLVGQVQRKQKNTLNILYSSKPIVGRCACPQCGKPEDTLNTVVYFLYTEHGWDIERIDAWLKEQEKEGLEET